MYRISYELRMCDSCVCVVKDPGENFASCNSPEAIIYLRRNHKNQLAVCIFKFQEKEKKFQMLSTDSQGTEAYITHKIINFCPINKLGLDFFSVQIILASLKTNYRIC